MPILIVSKHVGFGFVYLLFQIANSHITLNFGIIILHNMKAVLFMNLIGLWLLLPIPFAFQAEVNMLSSKNWTT
jgi:hypothetical protein